MGFIIEGFTPHRIASQEVLMGVPILRKEPSF
jgi:hypothetical protein